MNLPTQISYTTETGPQGTFEVSTVDIPRTGEETVIFWTDGSGDSSIPFRNREDALKAVRNGTAQTTTQAFESL